MSRGMRCAGNIKFTLHSLSFYNIFFLLAKEKVEKGSLVCISKIGNKKKNPQGDTRGLRSTPRLTRYFSFRSFSNKAFFREIYNIGTETLPLG